MHHIHLLGGGPEIATSEGPSEDGEGEVKRQLHQLTLCVKSTKRTQGHFRVHQSMFEAFRNKVSDTGMFVLMGRQGPDSVQLKHASTGQKQDNAAAERGHC